MKPAHAAAIADIQWIYAAIRPAIEARIEEFRRLGESAPDEELFAELAFCLFTPQTKARQSDRAIRDLRESGLLWRGSEAEIAARLAIVRFRHTKARHLVAAREQFLGTARTASLRDVIRLPHPAESRAWLVKNVKGLGWKEATHFLRNVGRSGDLAILDRHIMTNLQAIGAVRALPKSMTPRAYLKMERAMQRAAGRLGLPVTHLDFVMWYKEAGEVFK